ncbi:AQuaPorin or aquaglyceroporin related [Caenorhabditis elegans]|uniref:AQuaPorin or aquaglyceroporin related n=1 Tax=Caenorhabditis elegans TaxID=6239 RepID=Q7YWQ1_CAEEL|nr:AQuaPorin or aquaglyceroporin related [Caenorhabditis elegans]CAE18006.1 AQuaPorin or aquaglyceroporin related [Caenorhabditis elegans]|eukprot:NP_001022480.1 AQuaPorin or aquaglyceroporin related [Caenorhabditis elegans]
MDDELAKSDIKHSQFHNLLIRPNIGEFLGAVIFSFLACFAGQYQRSNDLVYPFLSAFSLYIARCLVSHLTPAHLNPAISLLQWLRNEIPLVLLITFCFVQLIGFLFGVTLFRALVTQTEFNDYIVMYEIVAVDGTRKINRLQAFLLEVVLSMIFFMANALEDRQEPTVAATWGFIQFVSYPLYGFTSNISLLLVTSTVSYIFSPLTTPSFLLLYLNVFASLLAVMLAWCIDIISRPSPAAIGE